MKEKIKYFMKLLSTLTKEEADFISDILHWEAEDKAAFIFAKRMFEEEFIPENIE